MHPILDTGLGILAAAAPPADGTATGSIGGILLYITIALAFSFLCSMLEAGLLSTPLSYIEMLVSQGSGVGKLMQKHKTNVEKPISAILTLNTFAHTIGAAGAGAEATAVFGSEWFGLISFILTLLILIFSEIIPKTIGAVYWRQLMPFVAFTIQLLIWVLYPLVWLLQQTTRLIGPEQEGVTITRSELEVMAQISAGEGNLVESETRVLRNLLHLNNVQVWEIMTPRTVLFALHQDMTIREVMDEHSLLRYSRIPIYDETIDDVKGFVLRHELYSRAANQEGGTKLATMKRDLHAIPETITVIKVLEEFMRRQEHIFLIFDEYGGTAGVITLEDAIESLLGAEITDESDMVVDMREMALLRYKRQMGQVGVPLASNKPSAGSSGKAKPGSSEKPGSSSVSG